MKKKFRRWTRPKAGSIKLSRSADSKPAGTTDRRLAETIFSKIRVQIVEGRFFERREEENRTFFELMDRYLTEHVVKKVSQRSYRGYVKSLKAFFGDRKLSQITPKLIVQYKDEGYASGRKRATINRELSTLKKAFNLAMREWEWCRENPVSRVSMERENNKRDRWLREDEEQRLLASCNHWLRDLIQFALNTGMRLGELLGLTWRGVDLSRRTVTVFHSKNGERRTIPVNETVLTLLKEKARVRLLKTGLVFYSKIQTPLQDSHLRRSFS